MCGQMGVELLKVGQMETLGASFSINSIYTLIWYIAFGVGICGQAIENGVN